MEKQMTRPLAFFMLVCCKIWACHASEKPDTLSSGVYGDLTLAVDLSRDRVSGFFESEGEDDQGGKPTWSCSFYLYGKGGTKNGRTSIVAITYLPPTKNFESHQGEIISDPLKGGQYGIRLRLDGYPPGCARGEDFTKNSPRIGLDEARPATEFRLVTATKARFYVNPNTATAEPSYVVRGDIVEVIERKNSFVKASFGGENGVTTGWLKESDLQPLE